MKKPNTKLVQQEDAYGCAIACLAMATGKSYKFMRREVANYFHTFRAHDGYSGLADDDEQIILYKLGYRLFSIRRPMELNGLGLRKFVSTMPALLTLPSINVPGLFHATYWDGKNLYDPSKLKTYSAKRAWRDVRQVKLIMRADKETHSLFGVKGELP